MPRMADFPPVARAEATAASGAEDNGPMGLLKRLANGLGHPAEQTEQALSQAAAPTVAPAAPTPISREDDSPYAPPRNGTLDVHGRSAPSAARASGDDDQLDIPAFLRRQAN